MLKSTTGHLIDISGGPNLSLELVILIIKVKNVPFTTQTAVWHDSRVDVVVVLKLCNGQEVVPVILSFVDE